MALVTSEVLGIVGRLLERLQEKLEDPETPGKVTTAELFDLIQQTLLELLNDFQD